MLRRWLAQKRRKKKKDKNGERRQQQNFGRTRDGEGNKMLGKSRPRV
jgi:hypothetical protein